MSKTNEEKRVALIKEGVDIANGYTTTTQEAHNPHDNVIVVYDENIKEAVAAITNNVLSSSKQKLDNWISVDDRLPPIGIRVLCQINNSMRSENTNMIVIDYLEKSDNTHEFVHNYKHNYKKWRLIPSPPEAK